MANVVFSHRKKNITGTEGFRNNSMQVEYSEITTTNIHNMNKAKLIHKKYRKHGMIPV